MKFEAFVWGPRYLTGIPLIDTQHQRLVELINSLGGIMVEQEAGGLPEVVAKVRAYAEYHFRAEESIWANADIAPEEQAAHQELHLDFVMQLANLEQDLDGDANERADILHRYLTSWLIFHILGEDHVMSRKVLARESGDLSPLRATTPSVYFPPQLSATEAVLLAALNNLHNALAAMNSQLRSANASLEDRVRARTRELESLNEALIQERDLLAQANDQLDETRSRLLESEKMASIGQLAAGVAHEINNRIGFVNSNLGTLREYLDDTFAVLDTYAAAEPLIARDPQAIAAVRAAKAEREIAFVREDAMSLLDESRDGLLRVKRIVQDLKTFSHVDQSEWQRVDLRVGLESTLNIVWNELRQKAELRREFGEIPAVQCNAGQINQVFMNLLTNAAQAIDRHGLITVRTRAVGDEVCVEVEDNGCGIAPDKQSRIFEPFFTTKAVGKGTGLGLSLAWSIVQKHGGRLEVDSVPGEGSCFRVCLPVDGPPAAGLAAMRGNPGEEERE